MDQQLQQRVEQLGPAERIVGALTNFMDHVVHNRPGMVVKDPAAALGVRWEPVIWKEEDGKKVVYKSQKVGRRTERVKVGAMNGDLQIKEGRRIVGEYRKPGLYPESAAYLYEQVAKVWQLDNEFAARWASWSFPRDHKDMKVVLCAFMLVQGRTGDPVIEDGKILFYDEDFRDVGEAMCLIRSKIDLSPKHLLRVGDVLNLPQIAEINRRLGFGKSARNPAHGRYYKVVEKWLRYREENLPMLEGLVKAGFRTTVMKLARRVGYKPTSDKFFEVLRWKQDQAKDGRRTMAVGKKVKKAETWEGKDEKEICEAIVDTKPNWKRIVGMLPKGTKPTKAMLAAAIEVGCLSERDLVILSPTIEEFGLDKDPEVGKLWREACTKATDQRAANIAKNVRTKAVKDVLEDAVDKATEKAMAEVTKDMRVYCVIDKSGSMQGALEKAQEYLTKFLGGFPLERLHVSVFNTTAVELTIRAPKAAAVRQAFVGHSAGGGTHYFLGVRALAHHKPLESEDSLILFVGDEADSAGNGAQLLAEEVRRSGINPTAFGLLKVIGSDGSGRAVTDAAAQLGIPCFKVDTGMFTSNDPYAVTRMLRDLVASTPVGRAPDRIVMPARKSLVEEILGTALLKKPVWA